MPLPGIAGKEIILTCRKCAGDISIDICSCESAIIDILHPDHPGIDTIIRMGIGQAAKVDTGQVIDIRNRKMIVHRFIQQRRVLNSQGEVIILYRNNIPKSG